MNSGAEEIRIAHYRLARREDDSLWELGRGARDVTYKAFDLRLERFVALRHLPDEYAAVAGARDAFLDEARHLARLPHPHLAALLELSAPGGPTFFTMEHVSDETVEALVHRTGPLSPRAALAFLEQAARALEEIWRGRLVATDLAAAKFALAHHGEEAVGQLRDLHLVPVAGEPGRRENIRALGGILRFMLAGPHADPRTLERAPQDVTRLLDAMLAEDPARGIASSFELARRIRDARHAVDGRSAPVRVDPPLRLAERFVRLGAGDDGNASHFEAEDRHTGAEAIVHVFRPEEPEGEVRRALVIAERVTAHPHPHILAPLDVHADGAQRYVAYERPHGFRLLDVLRRRRQLTLAETLLVAEQLASALDHAAVHDLADLDFPLAAARVVFPRSVGPERFEALAGMPLFQWPPFAIKVPPRGAYPRHAAPGEPSEPAASPRVHQRAFAETVHELLGGIPPRRARAGGRFAPVAALTESGNELLKRLMGDGAGAASGAAIVEELRASMKVTEIPLTAIAGAGAAVESAPEAGPPSGRLRRVLLVLLGLALAAGLAFLGFKHLPGLGVPGSGAAEAGIPRGR